MSDRPIATCPDCGECRDGMIHITASCLAVIEGGDSFNYSNCNVSAEHPAYCCSCGFPGIFADFRRV